MAPLYGRAGRLTAENGGLRSGQVIWGESSALSWSLCLWIAGSFMIFVLARALGGEVGTRCRQRAPYGLARL